MTPLDLQLMNGAARGIANGVREGRRAGALTDEPTLDGYAWQWATDLMHDDVPFAALIAAALYRADTGNAALIRACWPGIAADTQTRYDTPGGLLPSEIVPDVRS